MILRSGYEGREFCFGVRSAPGRITTGHFRPGKPTKFMEIVEAPGACSAARISVCDTWTLSHCDRLPMPVRPRLRGRGDQPANCPLKGVHDSHVLERSAISPPAHEHLVIARDMRSSATRSTAIAHFIRAESADRSLPALSSPRPAGEDAYLAFHRSGRRGVVRIRRGRRPRAGGRGAARARGSIRALSRGRTRRVGARVISICLGNIRAGARSRP